MEEIKDFFKSRSVVNLTIVMINVIVFLVLSFMGDTENADFMVQHGASYTPYIVQDGKYYLLVTSMFLHFGFSHLMNNMVMCWKRNLERFVIFSFILEVVLPETVCRFTWICKKHNIRFQQVHLELFLQ